MPGIGRWFGFGLFAEFDEDPGTSYRPDIKSDPVPFRCPYCQGVRWSIHLTLKCRGTAECRHTPTQMRKIRREGENLDQPFDTDGLDAALDFPDE